MPSSLKYIFVISIATAPNSSVDIGALGSCRSRNGYLIISYFKTCFVFFTLSLIVLIFAVKLNVVLPVFSACWFCRCFVVFFLMTSRVHM